MADYDLRPDDLVKVTLTLKSRDQAGPLLVNEALTVEALGMQVRGAARPVAAPEFNSKRYVELLTTNQVEEASRMLAEFHDAAADAVADGVVPQGEQLAEAIVRYFVRNGVRGNVVTDDPNARTGYVLNTGEVNIAGPLVSGDTRVWKCSAVGTWGK